MRNRWDSETRGRRCAYKAVRKYRECWLACEAVVLIAAIGAFDGFHKGHQALLNAAGRRAARLGTNWGTVTFEVHPNTFLVSSKFKSLFTKRERLILEKFFGVPAVHRIEFTRQVADMPPDEFLDYLSNAFGVNGVVVGEGFRFGKNRAGTTEFLRSECSKRGWISEVAPVLRDADGNIVSSSAIREAVSAGDMERAREMQGYPFFCVNQVVHGNERGRTLGFPTANLDIGPDKVTMRYGVYSALVLALGKWHIGAANVGLNPTFTDVGGLRFEVNLLDFSGDLYDREIAVFLIEYVRDERRFDSSGDLREQMCRDAVIARETGERALGEYPELWEAFAKAIL